MLYRTKVLAEKLGEEGLRELEELFRSREEEYKKAVQVYVEEKFERRLAEEIGKLRVEMKEEIGKVWTALEGLRAELGRTEARLARMMLWGWMTTALILLSGVILLAIRVLG